MSVTAEAIKTAINTYSWIIADHPNLDPDEILPRELALLKRARAREEKHLATRHALLGIINAANANPEPIHYKIREAIDAAREVLRT